LLGAWWRATRRTEQVVNGEPEDPEAQLARLCRSGFEDGVVEDRTEFERRIVVRWPDVGQRRLGLLAMAACVERRQALEELMTLTVRLYNSGNSARAASHERVRDLCLIRQRIDVTAWNRCANAIWYVSYGNPNVGAVQCWHDIAVNCELENDEQMFLATRALEWVLRLWASDGLDRFLIDTQQFAQGPPDTVALYALPSRPSVDDCHGIWAAEAAFWTQRIPDVARLGRVLGAVWPNVGMRHANLMARWMGALGDSVMAPRVVRHIRELAAKWDPDIVISSGLAEALARHQ
jgi:hypothetical protein